MHFTMLFVSHLHSLSIWRTNTHTHIHYTSSSILFAGLYLYMLVVQTFSGDDIKFKMYAFIGWGMCSAVFYFFASGFLIRSRFGGWQLIQFIRDSEHSKENMDFVLHLNRNHVIHNFFLRHQTDDESGEKYENKQEDDIISFESIQKVCQIASQASQSFWFQ